MVRSGSGRRLAFAALDWRRLLSLAGATALLVLGLFCAWQAWLIVHEQALVQQVQTARDQAARALASEIAREREPVEKVLAGVDPAIAMSAPQAAIATWRRQLPQVLQLELFSGSLDEVLRANYRVFGYAKAAQLMAAPDVNGVPLAQTVISGDGERRLSFVIPVGTSRPALGWAWVELPFAGLQQRFASLPTGGGRLDLRQSGPQGYLRLLAHGSPTTAAGQDGVAVPGSAFNVGAALPQAFIVLPRSLALASLLAFLGVAGGLALLYWRMRAARPKALVEEHAEVVLPESTAAPKATRPAPRVPAAAGAAKPAAKAPVVAAPVAAATVDPGIFRAYDVRGVVGTNLTSAVAERLGQAVGALMLEKNLHEIVVGRDGRLSGPDLVSGLCTGLRAAGVDVLDIGAVPTPVLYFATFHCNTGCGVMVTGSHNPPDYNGFKIVVGGETLAEGGIQDLYQRIAKGDLPSGGHGSLREIDVGPDYLERVVSDVLTERRLRVVVDAGNGIAGKLGPELLTGIGCDVIPLYCDVDGTFPNHHPDPSDPANLRDLVDAVGKIGADLGVAFDGDGDRLGVVSHGGEIISPDRVLILFARDVLSRQPGATVIYDVKCTSHLKAQILDAGGSPLMWRTGHSLIKAKMRETDAELAGEMSGHFFFKERWYGFDDGLYSAARLLEILAGDLQQRSPDEIFASLPRSAATPELKIPMREGEPFRFMEKFRAQATFADAVLTTIDGVRADWPDGWGLVRASNTTPVLVLRFEADTTAALRRVQDVFRQQLLALESGLQLPF
ncbi:MAG: phosphomannomutase/phosphoglucomutase [Xanthomonadales bacterium]|nr:phosphomannomutase/phosphoglucomutase [Xanthomonadales bacterium]